MTENAVAVSETIAQAKAGLYLTFSLGEEIYGLEILTVQEIIGMTPVTCVPRTPDFVRGVINLRGRVIPVIDLRVKFDMPATEDTARTCIIVVQVGEAGQRVTMGVIVDEVAEVADVPGAQIEPSPAFGAAVDTAFILGVGKIGDKVVMLLDADKVLSAAETEALAAMG